MVERALRAELGELRALNAELRLSCELYIEQVAALRKLEREWVELEREWVELERVSGERDRLAEREIALLRARVAELEARITTWFSPRA